MTGGRVPPGGPGYGAPPPPSGRSARRCAVTTGFFVLQPCGAAMVSACLQCGRPVCLAHVQPGGWCSECAAAQDTSADHPLHPLWAQRQRRRTYASVADEYQDLSWYSTFDALDRASFDPQSGAGVDPFAGGFAVDGDGDVDADDDRDGDGDIDADDLDYGTDS